FDRHPSVMMGFLMSIEGIGPLIRSFFMRINILLYYFNKHHVTVIPFVQTNSASDDWGTKPDDLRNELSLRTFFVMNEIDGSGGEGGVVLMFLVLFLSAAPYLLTCDHGICLVAWDIL
ncbi:hypothetical protein Tco_1152180, partial [Tanacetum coccineum]